MFDKMRFNKSLFSKSWVAVSNGHLRTKKKLMLGDFTVSVTHGGCHMMASYDGTIHRQH